MQEYLHLRLAMERLTDDQRVTIANRLAAEIYRNYVDYPLDEKPEKFRGGSYAILPALRY
jgi:hypothetical protein